MTHKKGLSFSSPLLSPRGFSISQPTSVNKAPNDDTPLVTPMPYFCIVRDCVKIIEVNLESGTNLNDRVKDTAKHLLDREVVCGWDSFPSYWVQAQHPFRGLRFHLFLRQGPWISYFVFACIFNSRRIRKKTAQAFLERATVMVKTLCETNDAWLNGNVEQCENEFLPIFQEWVRSVAEKPEDCSCGLELSRQIEHENRLVLSQQSDYVKNLICQNDITERSSSTDVQDYEHDVSDLHSDGKVEGRNPDITEPFNLSVPPNVGKETSQGADVDSPVSVTSKLLFQQGDATELFRDGDCLDTPICVTGSEDYCLQESFQSEASNAENIVTSDDSTPHKATADSDEAQSNTRTPSAIRTDEPCELIDDNEKRDDNPPLQELLFNEENAQTATEVNSTNRSVSQNEYRSTQETQSCLLLGEPTDDVRSEPARREPQEKTTRVDFRAEQETELFFPENESQLEEGSDEKLGFCEPASNDRAADFFHSLLTGIPFPTPARGFTQASTG